MNRPTLSALLAAPLLTALSPVADDLSFHPSDGSEVTRRYTIELDFELGDLSIVADGQDVSEMIPSDQMSGAAEIAMKVTESFVRSAEGRPLELIRYFEEMSGEAGPEGQAEAMEDIDKLEGKRVRFLWNEDEGAYDVTFHESEGDAEDLEGLTPDMDLRALLPGKAVSAGDTWSIDAKELHSVLLFGDKPESGDEQFEELLKSSVWPQVQTLMDQFKTTCEYLGERDVDGRKVGAIAVTMHGEGRIDLSQFILEVFQMQVGETQVDLDIAKADVALTFDSKGELLWDLAGGHLRAFDMACDADVALEFSGSADVQGESHSADADAEFAVTGNWKVAPAE